MSIVHLWPVLDETGFAVMRVLLTALWQSSILLAAVGALAWLLRWQPASLRHTLWTAALILAPVAPLLTLAASHAGAPQATLELLPPRAPAAAVAFTSAWAGAPDSIPDATPAPARGAGSGTAAGLSPLASPWAIALLAYAAGAAAFLTWLAMGRVCIRRWTRSAAPVLDERVVRAFGQAARDVGLRERFRLLESDCIPAPLSAGVARPFVLLPKGMAEKLADRDLRALALHELAHIRRRDHLVLFFAALVRAVLFFHPLAWLAGRRIATLSEQAADDAVLDAAVEPLSYAKMLAQFAEGRPRPALAGGLAAGIIFSRAVFLDRIEAILSDRRGLARRLSPIALGGTLCAMLLFLGVATAFPLGERSSAGALSDTRTTHDRMILAATSGGAGNADKAPAPVAAEAKAAAAVGGAAADVPDGGQPAEAPKSGSTADKAGKRPAGRPVIVSTTPEIGAADVPPDLTEITVTFDQDMSPGYSWTGGGPLYPKTTGKPSWRDKRTCVLPVQLEAGHFYRVGINAGQRFSSFRGEAGLPTATWAIWFCTRGASADLVAKLKQPKIVATVPAIGDQNVDLSLTEVKITFDQEMGGGFSWTGSGPMYPKTTGRARWDAAKRTCILPVKLEPDHQYQLGLNSVSFKNFSSAMGVPVSPVLLRFKTRGPG